MTTATTTTSPEGLAGPDVLDDERRDLLEQLRVARATLVQTVRDLTDEQAGERPTVSELCLGGLIKHVADVEERWLRFAVGDPGAMRFDLPEGVTWEEFMAGTAREFPQWAIDRSNSFRMQPDDTLAAILERYADVAARTERIVAELPDLSVTHPLPEAPWLTPGEVRSARRVLTHVILETAQHAGHADILRESLDGQTST